MEGVRFYVSCCASASLCVSECPGGRAGCLETKCGTPRTARRAEGAKAAEESCCNSVQAVATTFRLLQQPSNCCSVLITWGFPAAGRPRRPAASDPVRPAPPHGPRQPESPRGAAAPQSRRAAVPQSQLRVATDRRVAAGALRHRGRQRLHSRLEPLQPLRIRAPGRRRRRDGSGGGGGGGGEVVDAAGEVVGAGEEDVGEAAVQPPAGAVVRAAGARGGVAISQRATKDRLRDGTLVWIRIG